MKALILAAGYGTRLYPLTKEYPKPLLPIRNRPVIDYIMDKIEAVEDIDEVVVVTNSKFISRFKKWVGSLRTQKRISLIDDLTSHPQDRRGAIGDMKFAIDRKHIKGDLLVIGADNLFESGLEDFLSFAKSNKPHTVIGAYDIMHKHLAKKYGVIKLNRKKRIVDFREKPDNPQSTFVAMCLYYFPKEKLKLIREYLNARIGEYLHRRQGQTRGDAMGFYIDWLRKKEPVYGFVFDGWWYDIGDFECYNKARDRFLK